ncbi:hypothetical protein GEMRC1_009485 [Eukaryota sp. GEM-RC1]
MRIPLKDESIIVCKPLRKKHLEKLGVPNRYFDILIEQGFAYPNESNWPFPVCLVIAPEKKFPLKMEELIKKLSQTSHCVCNSCSNVCRKESIFLSSSSCLFMSLSSSIKLARAQSKGSLTICFV